MGEAFARVGGTHPESSSYCEPVPSQSRRRTADLLPVLILGVLAAGAASVFAVLAFRVPGPEVFGDEMFYMEAATSFARGQGLHVREGSYGFGPVFPILASVVLKAISNRVVAYHAVLALNGLLVASAVAPIYVMARRLLSVRAASVTAAVCLLMPCSFYAASFMTESLGYVMALWALLAIVRAVESPTIRRQVLVLTAVVLASAVRTQFIVLIPTFLLALGLRRYLEPKPRSPIGPAMRRLWPTWSALGITAAVAFGYAARTGSPAHLLGSYADLWQRYDVVNSVAWTVWHAFDLFLYLSLIPVIALPAMVGWIGSQAHSSIAHRSFLAVFCSANGVALALAGVFGGSEFGHGRLHDRYIFYVVPLWVILLVGWVRAGIPRSRASVVAGGLVGLGLIAVAPLGDLVRFSGAWLFDGAGTITWAVVRDLSGSQGVTKLLLVGVAFSAVVVVARLPASSAWILVSLVALGFLIPSVGMWTRAMYVGDRHVFAGRSPGHLLWVDRATMGDRVLELFVDSAACRDPAVEYAYVQSEFFNASVGRVAHVGSAGMERFGLPEVRVTFGPSGELLAGGAPLSAAYVMTARGVPIAGHVVARGTKGGRLVLWRVAGPIRVQTASIPRLLATACR